MGFFQKLLHALRAKEEATIPTMEDTKLSATKTNFSEIVPEEPEVLQTEQIHSITFPEHADDLNKAELILLRYMDNTRISSDQITLPNYFT